MKRAFPWIVLALISIWAAGCSPSATLAPVSTSNTATMLPPTITSVPSETAVPTATRPVVLEDITAIWTREDFDRGTLFLILNEDGTFVAAHGSPSEVVHSGTYSFNEGVFTFEAGWDCSPTEGDVPGKYTLKQIADGSTLFFTFVEDACPDRPQALNGRWNRVKGTPVP